MGGQAKAKKKNKAKRKDTKPTGGMSVLRIYSVKLSGHIAFISRK